jgi:uncharacterized membrane protein YbhN (UPF0104 family)
MESNTIYVTKREFYSATLDILGCVLLIVAFSSEEFTWRQYVLSFLTTGILIFYLCKALKERSKSARSSRAEK